MGIDFRAIVLFTFALGSALAAFAGVMDGLYYNEVYFGMGLLLGVIGFAIALIYALFWAGEQSRWNRRWGRPRYGPDEPTRTY